MDSKSEIATGMHRALKRAEILRRARGAEMHHLFIEARETNEAGFYLASCLCSISAIEASLRFLRAHAEGTEGRDAPLEHHKILTNKMLRECRNHGLDTNLLAIEGAEEFNKKIESNKPDVKIVKVRHNLCHGNLTDYFKEGPDRERIFTPEMMRPLSSQLLELSNNWLDEVSRFKTEALGL